MSKGTYLKKLGEHISRLRERKGFTQADFARHCDKDAQSINRLEKGRINPSIYYLYQIASELGVTVKELVDFE